MAVIHGRRDRNGRPCRRAGRSDAIVSAGIGRLASTPSCRSQPFRSAMKYRWQIVVVIAGSALVLWSIWLGENGSETAASRTVAEESERISGSSAGDTTRALGTQTVDSDDVDPVATPPITDVIDHGGASLPFGRISPSEIEAAVYQRIAEQPGLSLTSLTSVACDTLTCTVVFSGIEADPQYVDEYGDLLSALTRPPWNDYQPTSGSIGTREVSPGAREYVLGFTYVALVDTSDDPRVAALQHAACAGAWSRVTQQRGSDDYIRMAHEQAAEYLELAARTLDLEEAERLADELQFGPLTRECRAAPY